MLNKMTKLPFVRTLIATVSIFLVASCQKDPNSETVSSQQQEVEATKIVSYQEFKQSLGIEPETGYSIIEGDLLLTNEQELKKYYETNVLDQANNQEVGSRLIVGYEDGADLLWDSYDRVNLTYCVDTSFGTNYNAVVTAMNSATSAWEAAAGQTSAGTQAIDFRHLSSYDSSCESSSGPFFRVLPGSSTDYVARAFFPGAPASQRVLYVTNSAFSHSTFSLEGILSHETGHTLGFRHESVRYTEYVKTFTTGEMKNCYGESGQWKDLSDEPWDDFSVMRTPECNPYYFMSGNADLELSVQDKEGVKKAYTENLSNLAISEGTTFTVWNSTTWYYKGDVIFYSGDNSFYKATPAGVLGYTPYTEYWLRLTLSISSWVEGQTYQEEDIVYYPANTKFYQCLESSCVASSSSGIPNSSWNEIDPGSVIIHGRGELLQ